MDLIERLKELLDHHSPSAACSIVAEEFNIPTSDVIWQGHYAGLFKREFQYGEQF